MLQVPVPFPFPGSTALFGGLRWRVQQIFGDRAIISRDGPAASLRRSAPLAELVDPARADENATLALTDASAATRRIALCAAKLLRDRNDIALRDLGRILTEQANAGRIPHYRDNSHLARIMRGLGWYKIGYQGEGYERSPLYARRAQVAA